MKNGRKGIYYGWMVVGVAFAALFVNYGIRYTNTVLLKSFTGELGIGRGQGSLPFTVSVLVYAFLAPLAGRLVDRYGPRMVIAGGSLLAGMGLWACSRATNLWTLVFLYGIVFGVGSNGIGLVPTNTSVATWFRQNMGTALGVATTGIGFGTMVLPRLMAFVDHRWGWRASFQALGYITLALAPAALMILRRGPGSSSPVSEARECKDVSERWEGTCDLTLGRALRTSSFWLLFVGFVLIVIALYGVMVHQVPYATDRGLSADWSGWSVTVVGAFSIFGRFFFGWLSDRVPQKKQSLYPACAFLMLAFSLLFLVRNPLTLMLFAAAFGVGYAAYGPVVPAVVAEVFGKKHMGSIFGLVTTGGALGGALGPYLTGAIYDRTGSYWWAWFMGLACVLLSTLLFAGVRNMAQRLSHTENGDQKIPLDR